MFSRSVNEGDDRIYKIKTDGTGEVELTNGSVDSVPVFSPDGLRIAFRRFAGLWTMNADGSDETMLAGDVHQYDGGRPSYSPDGSRIAFASYSVFDEQSQAQLFGAGIHSVNSSDGGNRTLLVPGFGPINPMYSPDGTQLAFINAQAPGRRVAPGGADAVLPSADNQLTILNADGSGTATTVTGTDGTESADWGPLAPVPPACKLRVSRARFFVFEKQNVYRLVARYRSPVEGEVTVKIFEAKAVGGKDRALGTLQRNFKKQGRFRIRVGTDEPMIRDLRGSENGFIAELKIKKRDG